MWVLLDAPPGGVEGWDWLWIVIAVLLDLGHYASSYTQRGSMSRGATAA
jgi:hypothetical protein